MDSKVKRSINEIYRKIKCITINVVDNLLSTDTNAALSANQGRILSNTKNNVIQFQDESNNLGAAGDVEIINFTGSGVQASISGNNLTVDVQGGQGVNIVQKNGITLLYTGWNLNAGLYEYQYNDVDILSTTIVDVIPDNADYSIVAAAKLLPQTISSAGSVKIFAVNPPTDDIGVTLNLIQP